MANYEIGREPVSQEDTLEYFLGKGWEVIEKEEKLVFVSGPKGEIRIIDENGYMRYLNVISNRWEEPKIKKYVDNNVKIAKARGKKK